MEKNYEPSEGASNMLDSVPESEDNATEETKPAEKEASAPSKKEVDTSKEVDTNEESTEENVPFHKHPRFQKLKSQRDEYRSKTEELSKKMQELEERINSSKDTDSDNFDINKIKQEIINDLKREQEMETKQKTEAQRIIDEQLDELRDEGLNFNDNELFKVAVDYGITDIRKAYEVYDLQRKMKEKEEIKTVSQKAKRSESVGNRTINNGSTKKLDTTSLGWDELRTMLANRYK